MRIGIYAPYYWPFEGGAERVARRVAGELALRHQVQVATLRFDPSLPACEHDGRVQVHRLPFTRTHPLGLTRTRAPDLVDHVRGWGVDLVHIHGVTFPDLALQVAFALRRRGVPCLLVTHGLFEAYGGGHPSSAVARWAGRVGVRILLGLLLWSSTRVALTSPAEQGILRAFRLPAARSSLVYNGFEPPCAELASAARFRPRHNLEGRLIVLHVATLKPNKGHGVMLDALVRLLPDCPSLHYVAVGQAGGLWQSHWESLQQSVARLGVPDRVHFLGHLSDPDLADAYAAADVVVVPSLAETFPLSVLDAMAWGKPLVASQVGGVGHMLSHERTGLLVPAGDGAALAVALGRLLREPALRASLGEAARAAVHARFAWPQVIERYEQLGRQLAGGG